MMRCGVRAYTARRTMASVTKYSEDHEYVTVEDGGDVGTIGITDFAQAKLGDIVYVELPEVGDDVEREDVVGSLESVKATSDLINPMSGNVVAINEEIEASPGLVNESPADKGWLYKVKVRRARRAPRASRRASPSSAAPAD